MLERTGLVERRTRRREGQHKLLVQKETVRELKPMLACWWRGAGSGVLMQERQILASPGRRTAPGVVPVCVTIFIANIASYCSRRGGCPASRLLLLREHFRRRRILNTSTSSRITAAHRRRPSTTTRATRVSGALIQCMRRELARNRLESDCTVEAQDSRRDNHARVFFSRRPTSAGVGGSGRRRPAVLVQDVLGAVTKHPKPVLERGH
mmetsp:Transcript_25180/g.63376  ORF Transcript_25180/g.63376 Transcript_25180/m.63376 type:complete len:209 (-) Transcript_25180:1206-1832(-)